MKKILMIGLIMALVLIIVGGAGVAYAQFRGLNRNEVVAADSLLNSDGTLERFGYGSGGMMGGR